MMKNKLYAVMFMLFLTLFSCCLISFSYASAKDGPPVSMEVSSIYDEIGKMGVHVPINVSLYGQSAETFEGTILVRTLENRAEEGKEVYEYQYPVQVNTAETKELQIYIPLGQKSSRIHLVLVDKEDNVITEKKLQFEVSRDMGRLLVGCLSEKPEVLNYLDHVGMEYGMVNSMLIPLDEYMLPDDKRGLELLDVLIINHFDTGKLTKDQIDAISGWVRDGGTLLFGTGTWWKDTLTAFAGKWNIRSDGTVTFERISLGMEFAENAPGESEVGLLCAEIQVKDGTVVLESDGIRLLTKIGYGTGEVGIYSYDLGELTEFAEKNPSYAATIFTDALGEDKISNIYYYSSYGSEQEYWNASSLVNTGSADRLPNVPVYAFVILVYVALIGPGFYLILRKRDMRHFYSMSVVIAAGIASVTIYLLGTGTRFTSQFLTMATRMEMDGGHVSETTYVNVRTPDNRPFSLTIPAEYTVTPLTRTNRYDEQPVVNFDVSEPGSVKLHMGETGTDISAKESKAFEPRYFKVMKESDGELDGQILGTLQYSDGKISGMVTNGMSIPLEDAALVLYGHMYRLGDLKPGEIRQLKEEELEVWPVGMSYVAATGITGESEESEEPQYLNHSAKNNLYSYYLDENLRNYQSGAYLVAMGTSGGFLSDESLDGQQASGLVFYGAEMDVSSGHSGLVYRSGLKYKPVINGGSGAVYGDGLTMYGSEPVSVEYVLGTDIQVEKLSFCPVSERFFEDSRYYYMKRFDGAMYFYNYMTKSYDRMDHSKIDYTVEELRPYLTQKNSLVVKYTAGETDHAGITLLLPHLMVTGREN